MLKVKIAAKIIAIIFFMVKSPPFVKAVFCFFLLFASFALVSPDGGRILFCSEHFALRYFNVVICYHITILKSMGKIKFFQKKYPPAKRADILHI